MSQIYKPSTSSPPPVETEYTITGDTGGAISPSAGDPRNWNLVGDGGVSVAGDSGTNTLTISYMDTWTDQGSSITMDSFSNYFATAGITLTTPAAPAQGDTIRITVDTDATVVLDANAGQIIRVTGAGTTTGSTFTNSARGDTVVLVYRSGSSTWFGNFDGAWTPA